MDFLPPEVRTQIFVCLPVKTLVRCTCVCRKWKSYIEDPSFVEAHLKVQRRDLMLVRTVSKEDSSKDESDARRCDDDTIIKVESFAIHCDDEAFTPYEKLHFPLTYPQPGGYFPIIGNCNGVICITTDQSLIMHSTYMWNPTIRKMVKLPVPRVTYESYGPFEHELGFGYDAKTNDYKVVRLVQLDYGPTLVVELYSLSTGIWRDISHLASGIVCQLVRNEAARNAYVNGAAHWVSYCGGIIVSFHFGEEVFRCFDSPIPSCRLRPVVVQDSLCLVAQPKNRCIVWMMKEYGDSNSWTKWLDIKLPDTIQRFIGFRNKGELLFQIDGKLKSFDHEKAQGKDLNILSETDLHFWNLIQQGHVLPEGWYINEGIYTYDPNAAPKDLGIESIFEPYMPHLFCDGYVVSLALIRESSVETCCRPELTMKKKSLQLLSENLEGKEASDGSGSGLPLSSSSKKKKKKKTKKKKS